MSNVLAYEPEEKRLYRACAGLYGAAEKRGFDLSRAWKKIMDSPDASRLEKLKARNRATRARNAAEHARLKAEYGYQV